MVCKPGSVTALSDDGRPFLWDAPRGAPHATNPGGEAEKPLRRRGTDESAALAGRPYSVLLPVGFTMPASLPMPRCALTAPFRPYPQPVPCGAGPAGGLLSVALSLGLPPPGVTRHRVHVEPGLSSPAPVAVGGSGHPAASRQRAS